MTRMVHTGFCRVCIFVVVLWCGPGTLGARVGRPNGQQEKSAGLKCPKPIRVDHAHFRLEFDGIQLRYLCDQGYLPVGYTVLLCAGTRWKDPPPVCVSSGCPEIGRVKHGSVKFSYEGGLARFACDVGYVMKGLDVLVCDGRSWNGTDPYCTEAGKEKSHTEDDTSKSNLVISKGAETHRRKFPTRTHEEWLLESDYSCVKDEKTIPAPTVTNGIPYIRWVVYSGEPRLYTLYRCRWGYVTMGDLKYLYCQQGEWVGNLPRCGMAVPTTPPAQQWASFQRDAGEVAPLTHKDWLKLADYTCMGHAGAPHSKTDPPSIGHASSVLQFTIIAGYPHLYTQYTCESGYKLAAGAGYMYCRNKGWQGDTPKCVSNEAVGSLPVINPCTSDNGGCDHVCVWSVGAGVPRCACRMGFLLANDGKQCEDINECENRPGLCGQHPCQNTVGSYRCACKPGYTQGRDGRTCFQLRRVNGASPGDQKSPLAIFNT